MKIDYKQIIEKIERTILANKENIKKQQKNTLDIKLKQFKYKLFQTALCATPFYIIALILISRPSLAFLTGLFNPLVLSALSVGVSTTIGYLIKRGPKKSNEPKTKDVDKYVMEVESAIEEHRLENKNTALFEIKNSLTHRQDYFNSLSDRYEIKLNGKKSIVELTREKDELQSTLQNRFDQLDVLSSKYILNHSFTLNKKIGDILFSTIITSVICGLIGMVTLCMPIVLNPTVVTRELYMTLSPFLIGGLMGTGYLKIGLDRLKACEILAEKVEEASSIHNVEDDAKIETVVKEIVSLAEKIQEIEDEIRFIQIDEENRVSHEKSLTDKLAMEPVLGVPMEQPLVDTLQEKGKTIGLKPLDKSDHQ